VVVERVARVRTRVRHRTPPAWSTPVGHHLTQHRQSS